MGFMALFLALGGVFSAAEAALFAHIRPDAEDLFRASEFRANWLTRALANRADALLDVLAGKYLFLAAAALALGRGVGAILQLERPHTFWTLAASIVLSWTILLSFGELIPRAVSQLSPERFARAAAPLAIAMHWLAWPIRLASRWIEGRSRMNGQAGALAEGILADEETIKNLVSAGMLECAFEEEEQEMIEGVLDLRDSTAGEIMTPRSEIEAYSIALSQEEMLDALRRSSHSRMPIFRESLDDIAGVLHAKEALLHPDTDYRELIRPPLMTAVSRPLSELLRDFKRNRTHLALAVDEYGGIAGVVSMHDILEEIVGEMLDPSERKEALWQDRGGGRARLAGALELEEAAERLGIPFPPDMGRTIGGFIMNSLGRMPVRGAAVVHAGYEFRVLQVSNRRIQLVEARPLTEREKSAVEAAHAGAANSAANARKAAE